VTNHDVLRLVEESNFTEVHHALLACVNAAGLPPEVVALARKLSAEIRNRCMQLSANRATDGSPEVFRLEALLRDVVQISGEGFYG
jgi:hypothetical protein